MTKTQKTAGKLAFPCSVWTLINAMVAMAWGYYREQSKKGVAIKRPRKFTCPTCQAKHLAAKKSPALAKRASQNVVVFWKKDGSRIAVCHVCGYTKREVATTPVVVSTAPQAPTCKCGNSLPTGRKAKCYDCYPAKKVTKTAVGPQMEQPVQVTSM